MIERFIVRIPLDRYILRREEIEEYWKARGFVPWWKRFPGIDENSQEVTISFGKERKP